MLRSAQHHITGRHYQALGRCPAIKQISAGLKLHDAAASRTRGVDGTLDRISIVQCIARDRTVVDRLENRRNNRCYPLLTVMRTSPRIIDERPLRDIRVQESLPSG